MKHVTGWLSLLIVMGLMVFIFKLGEDYGKTQVLKKADDIKLSAQQLIDDMRALHK
ncbi:hypothetical protein CCP1ISM_50022 [Azospirillaceae bacterium]